MPPMKSTSKREPEEGFEDTFSLTHLAQRWGVSRRAIRQMLQTGELPFIQIEGQIRIAGETVRSIELADLEILDCISADCISADNEDDAGDDDKMLE